MDLEFEKRIKDAIESVSSLLGENIDYNKMDPIARMMFAALIGEIRKIEDSVDAVGERIAERYCTDFIPYDRVNAIPAITLIHPTFRPKKNAVVVNIGSGCVFNYKVEAYRQPLNYIPVFNTMVLPYSEIFLVTHNRISYGDNSYSVSFKKTNSLWIGISTDVEVECLQGLSLMIKGVNGLCPKHIMPNGDDMELEFATMRELENIEMAEPFDAQQASKVFFSFIEQWKESLLDMKDDVLIYITDSIRDRDIFKPRPYPNMFKQWLENEMLDCFPSNTIWLQIDFPDGFVVPETCEVLVNVMPVANVDEQSLTLTQSSPIAKLQKQENSFFLQILETSNAAHRQGFNMFGDEIIVRDFDANCYNNGDLYRNVRNLYNHFVDDYYAFIEYNGIKDGELLKQLRKTINEIGKSVGTHNAKFKFDSGTYVMRNMSQQSSSIKVSYITTQGKIGNTPKAGDTMENKKLPLIEQKVEVVIDAMCGTDKATADERYELMRYYSLTNDRLYTKMDVDAFVRKELIAVYGREEFKRISVDVHVEGAAGRDSLQRGLYVDIEFKDKKNYEYAVKESFDKLVKQKIENKSCITMPINIELHNLDI